MLKTERAAVHISKTVRQGGFLYACFPAGWADYPAEVMFHMSPKELMYIEDALNHEQFLQSQFQQAAQALQNPQLKNCVSRMAQNHQQLFQKLYQLV